MFKIHQHIESPSGKTSLPTLRISQVLSSFSCVISGMCNADAEYQVINPTTQVALFSFCLDNCSTIEDIIWNIYQGTKNDSDRSDSMVTLQSECFDLWSVLNNYSLLFTIESILGNNTKKFTVSNQLFLENNDIDYWKFEVIYVFHIGVSSSAIQFKKNSPPSNGNCSIDPSTGTTSTLFRISCFNWFDEHQIKDYLTYGESLTFFIKNRVYNLRFSLDQ